MNKTFKSTGDYLGLKKTNKSAGISIALGCTFWQTKYKDIYLTDYDIINDKDLKYEGLMAFVCNCLICKISIDKVIDINLFNEELERFRNKIIIKK